MIDLMGELCPHCGEYAGEYCGDIGSVREYQCSKCNATWYD